MNKKRLVVIGLDGVPFDMLKAFANDGTMPNTAELLKDSFFSPMRSAIPEISCVAWSSIITGANPAEHGVFGFIDMHPGTYKMRFPNFNDLKAEPFWTTCTGKSVIINVPSTYPVKQMNGVHISGFVSIDFQKSVYPEGLTSDLSNLDYRLDVDSQKAHADMGAFLKDLDEILTARIKAVEYLWDMIDWQVYMPTFTGTDRLMHFLFEAYEDKNHKYHSEFVNHFRRIDEAIGWMSSKLNDDDTVMMLSDHGFEKLEKDVYVNNYLASEGFLSFQHGVDPGLATMEPATKAFALDPGRIFINSTDKFPAATLDSADKQACMDELENLFAAWQIDGKKVIKHIYKSSEVYCGPYIDGAAELILIAEKGFNLKGSMASPQLTANGPFTGKHTYHDAFLLVNDKSVVPEFADGPSVIDAGKLIKTLSAGS